MGRLLQSDQALLEWTANAAGAKAIITFGFRLKRRIPPSGQILGAQAGGDAAVRVAALLLEMPAGFEHVITSKDDVKNLNSEFPVAKASGQRWAEYDTNSTIGSFFAGDSASRRLLRIIRDQSKAVPVGTYGFSLPVRVPMVMPRENIWHLSLCSGGTCSSVDDANVVISFVLPGFIHGEMSPEGNFVFGAPRSASFRPALLHMPLLLLAMQFLRLFSR